MKTAIYARCSTDKHRESVDMVLERYKKRLQRTSR